MNELHLSRETNVHNNTNKVTHKDILSLCNFDQGVHTF